jgi:putative transposase
MKVGVCAPQQSRISTHQAFRFALDATPAQTRALASHCGASRFAFNWGLDLVRSSLETRRDTGDGVVGWQLPSLRRAWNRGKAEAAPWWRENSKEAYNSGLDALARSLANFSASRNGKRKGRSGFPRYHRRGRKNSCRFTTGVIRVDDRRHVTLPRLGRLRTLEGTDALLDRLDAGTARILSATVSQDAHHWFCSFTCVVERDVPTNRHEDVVGVDLGVTRLAALSTGEISLGGHALARSLRRLGRLSRSVARGKKGSARRRRATSRLARAHARVANLRRDHLHKLTTKLAKSHGRVVIEDLNVKGMMRSGSGTAQRPGRRVRAKSGLNRALADAALGEVRRMLEYKCLWYGSRLVVAPRFFPSSQRCSGCGAIREDLRLRDRTYVCGRCGLVIDRDLNAAANLVWWAQTNDAPTKTVAASAAETQNARGEDLRPGSRRADLDEARTEAVSEPVGVTGGPQRGVLFVSLAEERDLCH